MTTFKVPSHQLCAKMEGNYRKPQSGQPVTQPRLKTSTPSTQVQNTTATPTHAVSLSTK